VAKPAEKIGYDEILCTGHRYTSVTPAVEEFLLKREHEGPFFLSAGFIETHKAFPPHQPIDDPRYVRVPATLPDTPEIREEMAGFITMARQLDMAYGSILAALDKAGLADNTLVICTTDHGIAFPAMKCNLTQHGQGVALI